MADNKDNAQPVPTAKADQPPAVATQVPAPAMEKSPTADPVLHGLPEATQKELERIEKMFELDAAYLRRIVDQFVADFRKGLSKYGEPMAMIPTYVTGVPDGSETG